MADKKSLVKMNKMIHKKTGTSFLVVYVIYVSLVYTDSKKTAPCLVPRHTIFATFGRQLKFILVRIKGGLYLFHYVLDNLNCLLFVFLSNLIINLMYNIKKLYFNHQHKFRVLKTILIKLDKKVEIAIIQVIVNIII